MKKSVSILVSGKVQGVFYRASTKEVADQLGVKGFVRNEPNGDVYIEAVTSEETLNQFITWCKRGPARAVVAEVHIKEIGLQNFSDFRIER